MDLTARDLVDKWLTYARNNGISIRGSGGRPPEDTDVTKFLEDLGFDRRRIAQLVSMIPDMSSTNGPGNTDGETSSSDATEPTPPEGSSTNSGGNSNTPSDNSNPPPVPERLTDNQITTLNRVKRTIKSLNKDLVRQLLRDLRD